LEPLGFVMFEAENGQEGLEAFVAHAPQLVLMDMVMPVMDGCEATRRIRALPEGREVPIIAVSASVFEEQLKEIIQVGASDFLRKPLREAELFEKVAQFLPAEFEYEGEDADAAAGEGMDLSPLELAESLSLLPEPLQQELLDAARQLDKGRIIALVNGQKSLSQPVLHHIRSLAETYRFDLLEEALLQIPASSGGTV